jgi:tetratricopeptide (TPR) repeat protein
MDTNEDKDKKPTPSAGATAGNSVQAEHLRKAREMESSGLMAAASREYCIYAFACEEMGEYGELVKYLTYADGIYPISIQDRLRLSKALHRLGQDEEAARQYTILAESFFEQGLTERAVEILEIAIDEMPDSLLLHLELADLHARAKQTQKAIREYREVLNRQPDNPTAHVRLGDIYIKRNNRDEALQELAHAAEIYTSLGNTNEAIACYRKILKIFPDYVQFRRKLIEALASQQNKEEFIEECLRLADILWNNKEQEKAQKLYERILEIDPHNSIAQSRSSQEKQELKEEIEPEELESPEPPHEEAALDTVWEEARPIPLDRETEPVEQTDAATGYDLGLAYMEMALLDDAIHELQHAALDESYCMAASNLLGLCFLEQGRTGIAVRSFLRALASPGDDQKRKAVYFNLARAYMEMDEWEPALQALYDAYVIDAKFNDIATLIADLERRIKARDQGKKTED